MNQKTRPLRESLRLGSVFLAAGVAWIVLSDWLVALVFPDPAQQAQLQTAKGILFVLLGSALFAFLAYRGLSRAEELQDQLRAVTDQNLAGLYVIQDGSFTYVNERLAHIFGFGLDEMVGMPVMNVVAPDHRERVRRNIERRVRGEVDEVHYRLSGVRKDGTAIRVEAHGRSSTWGGRPAVIGVLIDVTEKEIEEEERRRSQRLEALGQLTGAVAHDFNNLLTAIVAPLDMCEDVLEPDHPAHADVKEAKRAADRAVELTRQLLAFGRRRLHRIRRVDLNELVAAMEPMLRRATRDGVSVHVETSEEVPAVEIDPTHFDQVLLNLVINAGQVIEGSGDIWIRTDVGSSDDGSAPDVLLEIVDNGIGMDDETVDGVFEPFLTTKKQGTGLGLATVHGIVTQAGGSIGVRSSPGKGTVFSVRLPGTLDSLEPLKQDIPPRRNEVLSTGGTILVVDDEAAVLRVASRILQRKGFEVLEAKDGHDALEIVERHGDRIDSALTDVGLPDMNGVELASRIRTLIPGIPIVYMSGRSDEDVLDDIARQKSAGYIEKPFTVDGLLDSVHEILAGEVGGNGMRA